MLACNGTGPWAARGSRVSVPRGLDLRQAQNLTLLDGLLGPSTLLVVAAASGAGRGMTAQGLADNISIIVNLVSYLEQGSTHRVRQALPGVRFTPFEEALEAAFHAATRNAVA